MELIGQDIAGVAVHIGARVSAKAGAGEILVSSTVRDLVVGSSLRFADAGEHELKGVPGTWRLFGLETQGQPRPALAPASDHMKLRDRAAVNLARRDATRRPHRGATDPAAPLSPTTGGGGGRSVVLAYCVVEATVSLLMSPHHYEARILEARIFVTIALGIEKLNPIMDDAAFSTEALEANYAAGSWE